MSIAESVARCRAHFQTGATIPIDARINALRALEQAILAHEADIYDALEQDLGKSATESYMCEVGLTLAELRHQLRHVRRWAARHRKRTGLANFHATSFTIAEPYGCVLIMSPWNYPFMLTMEPLVGALAAGNVCVVKPSAYSPVTSAVMRKIIASCLPEELVCVVEGGRAENTALLDQTFDYIFFTGGTTVGKLVMQKAAEHLTPITLELGGKSPCIIAKDTIGEAEAFIKARPKPLALYLFTRSKNIEQRFLTHVPFGGGCVNDTVVHLATSEMGFGGVGASGMGSYHGKKSFDTFSHEKSILKKHLWIDLPLRYQPFSGWKDNVIRLFLR